MDWAVKARGKHSFSVQTVLLAVNYLDCFILASSRRFKASGRQVMNAAFSPPLAAV
ncbi:hypothetical protein KSP40_PGU002950 [Platanthera guangdongensis]|uniref:Uncharacterized protein n=1 Tax=Platanthera guangdongensis TaxID=2320717 RepID=A0ABR2M2W2_9ASPA